MAHATVVLPATPPFRLDLTVWALRRRKKNVVDRWNNGHYSRIIVADGDPVRLTVSQETVGVEPKLILTVESTTPISERARNETGRLVQNMFGLAVDLQPFMTWPATILSSVRLSSGSAGCDPLAFRLSSKHWSIRSRVNR